MLSLAIAVAISASIMRAASTLNESRLKPEYFTRKRKLPFQKLLKYLLSMHKSSTQSALNNFLEREDITMSQQALSKARSKFDHTPFLKLFTAVRDAFYGAEYIDNLRKYHNKFLIAIDGSDTALPNLPSLIEKFGGTGSKSSSPTARMSIAYDVLNDFIIDAAFTPLNVSEREHAKNHIESVGKIIDLKNSIFIMDRGYASQELIEIFSEKSYYLFRLRTKFKTDDLSYSVTEDRVIFDWFPLTGECGEGLAYINFIDLLTKSLKESKRVNASKTQTENPKFAMRVFLIRIGMVGAEYKETRRILLRFLEGSSAFRKGAPHNEDTE